MSVSAWHEKCILLKFICLTEVRTSVTSLNWYEREPSRGVIYIFLRNDAIATTKQETGGKPVLHIIQWSIIEIRNNFQYPLTLNKVSEILTTSGLILI